MQIRSTSCVRAFARASVSRPSQRLEHGKEKNNGAHMYQRDTGTVKLVDNVLG
jgi:hypothetical protein